MKFCIKQPAPVKPNRPDQTTKRSEKPLFFTGQYQLSPKPAAARPYDDKLVDLYKAMDMGA